MKDRDIPNIADIIGNAFNEERPLQDCAADLGVIILEMEREKKYYGEHTRRMAELTKLAEVQQRVLSRALDRSLGDANEPKRPHLTVVR